MRLHADATNSHAERPFILGHSKSAAGIAVLLLLGAAAIFAPGCGTQGSYTKAHTSTAKEKMNALKSATEFQMAHQALLAGDLEKAMRHCDHSIQLNDKVARTWVLRGRIMSELNQVDTAIDAFAKAETLDPESIDAQYYQGVIAERLGRKEEALKRFSAASNLDPANAQYAIATAESLIDLGRIDEARTLLTSREERFRNNAGVRQALGHIELLSGKPELALHYFEEGLLLSPDDPSISEDVLTTRIDLGRYAQAEPLAAKLLAKKDFKDRRDLRIKHARCLVALNRPVEARELLLNLTRGTEGASDIETWIALGQVSYTLRDNARVREAAGRVIALDANRPEGYVLRGFFQKRINNHAEAARAFARAVSIAPTAEHWMLLGMSQQDMGKTDDAAQSFAEALRIEPGNTSARTMLAAINTVRTTAGAATGDE